MSDSSKAIRFFGATVVLFGGLYLYDQYQKNNNGTKKKIVNTTPTPTQPPTVRTPQGGWNASEGYFQSGNFSYDYK